MRKLTVNTFLTLDGVMQAPGGPEEDTSAGFTLGGWSFHYWDDVMNEIMGGYMGKPFDLLLGRKTYEIFAAFWPNQGDDNPAAAPLNNATKYVASRTLKQVDWQNSRLLGDDVVADITKLKEQNGPEIQVHGSGNLIQTLLQADLIDEFQVWTFPLVIGEGKRLFAEGTVPAALRVVESRISSTGVVITRYERAGEIRTGSFAE
jgi:dihydrofolate reductase